MYNGIERRGDISGRRNSDRDFCSVHHILQDERKDHRELVCTKIKNLKEDNEHDLEELKSYHDKDLENVKMDIEKKADAKDVKGILKWVAFLITICCIVVAGQAVWLKSDINSMSTSIKSDMSVMNSAIQRLNIRVTEATTDRVAADFQQMQKLEGISGQINTISWRLNILEEVHKPTNQFIPEKKGDK